MKQLFDLQGDGRWLLALLLALTVPVAIMAAAQVADYDFWWHVNLGRQIWQSGTPQVADAFSFTFAGQPQVNSEWLADLLLYGAFAGGGWWGILLCKALVLLLLVLLLNGALLELTPRRDPAFFAALFTLDLLLLFAVRFRLFPRPYLLSWLCIAALLWLLLRHQRTSDERLLWGVPVLALLWANLSVGVFFAPLLFVLYLAATRLTGRWRWSWAGLVMLTVLATLLTPDGISLYTYLFDRVFFARGSVLSENLPLSTHLLWGGGWRYTLPYQLLVVLAAAALWFVHRARPTFLLLLTVLCFAFSLRQVRMIDFFCIVALLPVGQLLARVVPVAGRKSMATAVVLVLMTAGSVLALVDPSYKLGPGFKESAMPGGAVAFLEEQQVTGVHFCSYPFGGYLPWAAPARRVFIDGRNDHLYAPDFFTGYFELLHTAEAWQVAAEKWNFEIAVLEYDLRSGGRHFPRHLASNPDWALVYWDEHSAVYLKRLPRFTALIERYGYRLVRPNFYGFGYLKEATASLPTVQALALAQADVQRNPQNQEPRMALVYLLYSADRRGYGAAIERELRTCLTLAPDLAQEHSALGMLCLESGRRDEALREAQLALALDPNDPGAKFLKGRLGL